MTRKPDIYNILGWLAMIAVPLAPAFFFGFEFVKSIYDLVYGWVQIAWIAALPALFVGAVSALGLEFVGVLSGHNAIRFWERNDVTKSVVCAVILVCYVILGIIGLESILTKGVVMFLVAPLVYVLVGMQNQLEKAEGEAREDKQEAKREARETRRIRMQYEHEERLAQIQASTVPAVPVSEPAESKPFLHKCEKCQRDFATVQAKNAHQRFCVGIVPVADAPHSNGVQKAVFD